MIAAFVATILALGFSAKLRQNSVVEYLTAGRNLTLPAFVATLVSTWYGGILGIGESVGSYGMGTWLLLGVPYYAFALAYAFWLAPKVREAHQISIPERLALRWGPSVGLLGATLVFILAVPAAHVLMLGSLIHQFTGWPLVWSVLGAALIGIALLYKGGLLADVRMGLLAFVGMYVGFIVMVLACVARVAPDVAFAKIENAQLLSFTGGVGWPVILSFFVLGAWTFVDPAFHQRAASAVSPKAARQGVLISVWFWLLFDILSITSALYAVALLHPMPDKLAVYPALAQLVLPPGLKALFLCGVLGTISSAMVGYTLVSGATFGREFVARLAPSWDEGRVKASIRIGLVLAMALAVPVALQVDSVVDLWYAWAGAMVGALLIPVLISYLGGARLPDRGYVFASMLLAAVVSLAWLAYGLRTNNPYLEVVWLKIGGSWSVAMPPVSDAIQKQATDSVSFGVGTLLPGLVISAGVLALGYCLKRKHE